MNRRGFFGLLLAALVAAKKALAGKPPVAPPPLPDNTWTGVTWNDTFARGWDTSTSTHTFTGDTFTTWRVHLGNSQWL